MKNWAAGLAVLTGLLGVTVGAVAYAGAIESDPIDSTVVMIAQANQAQDSTKKAGRVLGVCRVVANEKESYPNSIDSYAASAAMTYLIDYEGRNDLTYSDLYSAQTSVITQPKHGALTEDKAVIGNYYYSPDAGYVGKDSAEVLVEIKGTKVIVHYFIHITEYSEPDPIGIYCMKGDQWKISQDPNGNPILTAVTKMAESMESMGSDSIELIETNRIDFVSTMMTGSN